ncbi:hypothetical protein M1D80_24325 [Phyllobacteriaceae bacterium JZ32]
MEGTIVIAIQLAAGSVGGTVIGSILRNLSPGPAAGLVAGGAGGVMGGMLLQQFGVAGVTRPIDMQALETAMLLPHIAGGIMGGAVLAAITGAIKNSAEA